ncbi:MAG: hypothetical protein H0W28_11520 [Pyrinomonadaceae bacterium]|nr:hypothetical protein [Pyrinomonadaceae bacterium]
MAKVRKPEMVRSAQKNLDDWVATILVNQHPDFDRRLKQYRMMAESGELFAGIDDPDEVRLLREQILSRW